MEFFDLIVLPLDAMRACGRLET